VEFGIQVEPQFGFGYEEFVDIAHHAEEAGFTSLWLSDHLLLKQESVSTDCFETWTLLAALARETSRIRMGTMATCQSYRNPALLAKIVAGVDRISGGRIEFGVGAGWKEIEYRAYGYDFPSPRVRVEQLVDTIEICLRMWRDDKATYRGTHYSVVDAPCGPKPLQRPHPRLWVTGQRPGIMRAAAKYGDAVNVSGFPTPERYAAVITDLERACARAGRAPTSLLRSQFCPVSIGRSEREVEGLAAAGASRTHITKREWLRISGTPDAVVSQIRAYDRLGVNYLIACFPVGHEKTSLRLFADEVMPALA